MRGRQLRVAAGLAGRTVVYDVLGFTADEQSRLQWDAAGAELPDGEAVWRPDAGARFPFGFGRLVDGIAAQASIAVSVRARG